MRQAKAIVLTALICINLFGFYGMFIFKQAEIKAEMQGSIGTVSSNENRETYTYSKAAFAQLVFSDNGKELKLNGKLYDVVNIENSGNHVNVTLEYDSKETALVEAFGNVFNQQQDKDQTSSPIKNIISHFQQDYVVRHERTYAFDNTALMQYCMANRCYPVLLFAADSPTPPPQFFLA